MPQPYLLLSSVQVHSSLPPTAPCSTSGEGEATFYAPSHSWLQACLQPAAACALLPHYPPCAAARFSPPPENHIMGAYPPLPCSPGMWVGTFCTASGLSKTRHNMNDDPSPLSPAPPLQLSPGAPNQASADEALCAKSVGQYTLVLGVLVHVYPGAIWIKRSKGIKHAYSPEVHMLVDFKYKRFILSNFGFVHIHT